MKKVVIFILIVLVLFGGTAAYFAYRIIFTNNISISASDVIYIKTGSTYEQVIDILKENNVVNDIKTFELVSKWKKYPRKIKSGRYAIEQGMSNNELVNMLRSGRQQAVNFTFNNIRTKEQFVKRVSQQLETNPDSLLSLLNNPHEIEKYNVDTDNVLSIFIPNTYQMWWNTNPHEFIQRMYREYQKFWTEKRTQKASELNLSPVEIIIIASIVEEENHRSDEQSKIAGVYINRLKRKIKLDADPTVKFALKDFERRRLLNKDLKVESPYNTYKYSGLPPGPIRIPSPTCIDNVLNYEKHNYIFMCAKEDFSGYHNFAVTLREHSANAKKYHKALNRNKIKK